MSVGVRARLSAEDGSEPVTRTSDQLLCTLQMSMQSKYLKFQNTNLIIDTNNRKKVHESENSELHKDIFNETQHNNMTYLRTS